MPVDALKTLLSSLFQPKIKSCVKVYTVLSTMAQVAQLHSETVPIRCLAERSVKYVVHFKSESSATYKALVTVLKYALHNLLPTIQEQLVSPPP